MEMSAPEESATRVRTCLWMTEGGEDAACFYVGLLPNSRIEGMFRPAPDAPPLLIDFTLDGAPFQILQGAGAAKPSDACSISVLAADQQQVDRLWAALSDGGEALRCGWLRDRFGLAWQIVPRALPRLFMTADAAARGRLFAALQTMVRLDVAALEAAFRGETPPG